MKKKAMFRHKGAALIDHMNDMRVYSLLAKPDGLKDYEKSTKLFRSLANENFNDFQATMESLDTKDLKTFQKVMHATLYLVNSELAARKKNDQKEPE